MNSPGDAVQAEEAVRAASYERHPLAFVTRVWLEPAMPDTEPTWRGQVEHVGSGETAGFQVPAALIDLALGGLGGWPSRRRG